MIPYSGLLPTAFDRAIFHDSYERPPERICWVEYGANGAYSITDISRISDVKAAGDDVKKDYCIDLLNVFSSSDPKRLDSARDLEDLFRNFVDDFMVGNAPVSDPDGDSPYREKNTVVISQTKANAEQEPHIIFNGPVIPVYDFFCRKNPRHRIGGFAGWLVINLKPSGDGKTQKDSLRELLEGRPGFSLALRNFAEKVRAEQLRELIEEDWGDAVDAADFA